MRKFNASLLVPGDSSPLAATIDVDELKLTIRSGEHLIGDWVLSDVHFAAADDSLSIVVEGEELILEITDRDGFDAAVGIHKKKRRPKKPSRRPRGRSGNTWRSRTSETPATAKGKKPTDGATHDAPSADTHVEEAPDRGRWSLARLDRVLERLERRFGSLLPGWIFSRNAAAIAALGLVAAVIAPKVVSTLLLLTGLLVVVLGAVFYTDNSLAARRLPGRMTALHVLIGGVGFLVLGVLLGVVSG